MLLEKLCLQKWRKKKTEFKLHPSACTSHISSEAQLIITSFLTYEAIPTTKISSYLKFWHASFSFFVRSASWKSLSTWMSDFRLAIRWAISFFYWVLDLKYYHGDKLPPVLGGSKGCCTRSLSSDSFRISFKNCPDDDDDDFRFKKFVWFSGGWKERIL